MTKWSFRRLWLSQRKVGLMLILISLSTPGDYTITILFRPKVDSSPDLVSYTVSKPLTVSSLLKFSRPLFAYLHVHSDTVGTNSTSYKFSYGRLIAGLDILGYTANDFNITAAKWSSTIATISEANSSHSNSFLIFPGIEWCGNSAAGGDHNVVFLDDPATATLEF